MQNNFSKSYLFLSVLFFGIFLFIFLFLYQRIEKNNQAAQTGMTEWQNGESSRDEISLLNNSLKTIDSEKTDLETHFVSGSDPVPFLDSLDKTLATESGVQVEIISDDTSQNNTALTVVVDATGNFQSIYRYLTLLENSPYQLQFLSADIKTDTIPEIISPAGPSGKSPKSNTIVQPAWEAVFTMRLVSFIP